MKKQISILIAVTFFISGLLNGSVVSAAESQLSGFNPDKLIDDRVFSNDNSMAGAEAVQKFLEEKGSILANTSDDFKAKLKEPGSAQLKETVEDPHSSTSKLRTPAELIWDAAQASGLNPQVILVILNKEQSLITGRQTATAEQIQRALDFSMGFGCPDSQPCGELYRGFYFQLFGNVDSEGNRYLGAAGSLMKSFNTSGGRGPFYNGGTSKIGDRIILANTLGGYEGVKDQQEVTLSNAATAALYRYTPHVYNGNYNFWKFFTNWFGNPSSASILPEGSLVKTSRTGTVYIIQGGARYKVIEFVAKVRNLPLSNAQRVTRSELNAYPDKGLFGLPDNTLIKVGDKYYVFLNNIKRPASTAVLAQRFMNVDTALTVSVRDADLFETGPVLPPAEGSVLRGQTSADTYLVMNGVLKLFTPGTLIQYDAANKVQVIPDSEMQSYPKEGIVPPKEGLLVKGAAATVFVIEGGMKKPLSGELFKQRGYSFANVITIPDSDLSIIPTGSFPEPTVAIAVTSSTKAPPANMTWFTKAGTKEFYVYMNGGKHLISSFVAAQKKMTPDVTLDAAYVDSLPTSTPIIPKDNTILKGDKNPTVYIVLGGVIRPMTYQAFVKRSITAAQINILPQAEVDGYVKGPVLTQ